MALNGLLDIELSVPNCSETEAFWKRRGLVPGSDRALRQHFAAEEPT